MGQVLCRDESASGRELSRVLVEMPTDQISARELVRLRVREEVARHNAAPTTRFRGLVHPSDATAGPDGCWLLRSARRLDWELQADAAVRAFERNGFVLIVGDHQVEHLDEMIDLATAHEVAFVKLVPLVGG